MRFITLLTILLWSTAAHADPDAFSRPVTGLSDHQRATFHLGNSLFRKSWRPAPDAATASDGLGPLFNARSCSDCHVRDGRGQPPGDQSESSLILRLYPADPTYGQQIQDHAIDGHPPEGRVSVRYTEKTVSLAGGETVHLRKPTYSLLEPGYGPLVQRTQLSARVAPPVFGLGLLEAIKQRHLKPNPIEDLRDGISGRNNEVESKLHDGRRLGRFGWKAGQATIAEQVAVALSNDIGIASHLYPALWGDCTKVQADCRHAPHGNSERHGGLEVSEKVLRHLTFYMQTLAPPPQRTPADPQVKLGESMFKDIGCIDCHKARWITSNLHPLEVLHNREIHPYTDLLLHDMGEGLADGAREGASDPREWRTAPLWGIGLTQAVNGHTYFLHDGRARNLLEAILWHGGEAQQARDNFAALHKLERDAILAFLNSL